MGGIAFAALLLGQLADRFGRRHTIILGLTLFAVACFLFAAGQSFLFFAALLALSGIAIGIFKTGALALIGDLSSSTTQHTSIMNMLEGFFGIGAIVGPAILARLLTSGLSWIWLYVLAGTICVALIVMASLVRYPQAARATTAGRRLQWHRPRDEEPLRPGASRWVRSCTSASKRRCTCGCRRCSPDTRERRRSWPTYAVSVFFLLRAAGRFLGVWMLTRFRWQPVLALFSGCILLCFVVASPAASTWAVYLLPLSGLFMSVMYPTINSKGISCLPKAEHGAGAGVILFFTCVSAVLAPLAIGAVSDALGHIVYGFWLATGFAALLFLGMLVNWLVNPTRTVLERLDATDYRQELPIRRLMQEERTMAHVDGCHHRAAILAGLFVAVMATSSAAQAPQPATGTLNVSPCAALRSKETSGRFARSGGVRFWRTSAS